MTFKTVTIRWVRRLGADYVKMGIECGGYEGASPGQFVMVRIPGTTEPLLSRPFSIHDIHRETGSPDTLCILFRIVGRGTRKLAGLDKGDRLQLLGPLGKGFRIPAGMKSACVVSGGIGIAPLFFLLRRMAETGVHEKGITLIAGGRTKGDLLCLDELPVNPLKTQVTTDDGSFGERGLVTESMEKFLASGSPDMTYACGPMAMLKSVAHIAEQYGVNCQVSLETVMACGMGACLGCAVRNSRDPETYAHVCVDGPVFSLNEFGF